MSLTDVVRSPEAPLSESVWRQAPSRDSALLQRRLAACGDWASPSLAPELEVFRARPALPMELVIQFLERLHSLGSDLLAQRYLLKALAELPLHPLRLMAESSARGQRLFAALCAGQSVNDQMLSELPGLTSAVQRHALRCAAAIPDAHASTWHIALIALARSARHHWPAVSCRWQQLIDLARAAQAAAQEEPELHDTQALAAAVALSWPHAPAATTGEKVVRPHWLLPEDAQGADRAVVLLRRLVGFRSTAHCALHLFAASGATASGREANATLVDALVRGLAHPTDRLLVHELGLLLSDCPVLRSGRCSLQLVRSPAEAAAAGKMLQNCLRGAGRSRYAEHLLNGQVLAMINVDDGPRALVALSICLSGSGNGICVHAGWPRGRRNCKPPALIDKQLGEFGHRLEQGVFGLDRYAASITALSLQRGACINSVADAVR